jgi:ATP-dependent DNA helicase RecQ
MKTPISPNLRMEVLDRDGNKCVECGSGVDLNVHHVLPEKFGGKTIPSNLITLCRDCHMGKHMEYQAKYFSQVIFTAKNLINRLIGRPLNYHIGEALQLLTNQGEFRKYQRKVIIQVLNRNDVLFISPTGSGKSICFQIPAILLDKPTLVISPLKALMKDQVEDLWKKRVPATYINGDLDEEEKQKRLELIGKGLFKLIYATPEHFFNQYDDFKLNLNSPLLRIKYDLLVVDEAHCVFKWGRNFRPAYAELGKLRTAMGDPRLIALTASATVGARKAILDSLNIPQSSVYVNGFYRKEIILQVRMSQNKGEIAEKEKIDIILKYIFGHDEKIIIFVPTIKTGRKVWKALVNAGIETEFFYGKRKVNDKIRIQDEYKGVINSQLKVLICTSAFGMGINIPDIRSVIHWSIPQNVEDYYQQFGRAGRDGKESRAVLFYADGDEGLIRYINNKSLINSKRKLTEEERKIIQKIDEIELQKMLDYNKSTDKWDYILKYFGEDHEDIKQSSIMDFVLERRNLYTLLLWTILQMLLLNIIWSTLFTVVLRVLFSKRFWGNTSEAV